MSAFETEKHGEFAGGAGGENVVGGEAEGEGVGVAGYLLEGGVGEGEGLPGVSADGVLVWVYPEGEELGGEVAGARGGEVDHARAEGVRKGPAVEETLGRVGVGVDDQGLMMDVFGHLSQW